MSAERLESLSITIVAIHSLLLGVVTLLFPLRVLELIGWQYEGPTFFPAQSGLFLLLLGGAYLAGLKFRPFVWFLVVTKFAAIMFLVVEVVRGQCPPILLLQALADGIMGTIVALAAMRAGKQIPARVDSLSSN